MMLLCRTAAKNRRAEPLPPGSIDSYYDAKPMRTPASERCGPRRSRGGEPHKTSKGTIEHLPSQNSTPHPLRTSILVAEHNCDSSRLAYKYEAFLGDPSCRVVESLVASHHGGPYPQVGKV
jgi:hypothetical protein